MEWIINSYHFVLIILDKGAAIAVKISSLTTPLLVGAKMYYDYLKAKRDNKKEENGK